MKRILIGAALALLITGFTLIATGATNSGTGNAKGTYKVELDNAFGLVTGEQFKVSGVPAGTITSIDLNQRNLHAVVTVNVTESGFGSFRSDASCESRPQSLIGEYFLNCEPGSSGTVLKPGATIPVTHTRSTIPADLLTAIMRLPYRERLTLIINEFGAGVAGNSDNLRAAIRRAVPALDETDNLLNLLASDSHTIQDLTHNANTVITALANNNAQVARFITEANNTATATATQDTNLKATFQKLPGFLEELRPALRRLGQATQANTPVLNNLNAASGQLDRLLVDLPPFSHAALPALRSLGKASVTGKVAVIAAKPAVRHLNQFARPAPELAQNLAIVLHDLNDRSRAVEPDPRSPGGQGYTGLEAMLQYVFNQTLNIDYFGEWGHEQAIDAFISPMCSSFATPATIATNLKVFGSAYRQCYSWLGPNQAGVNSIDPSNPHGCVPDPGGEPPTAPAGAHPTLPIPCKAAADTGASLKTSRKARKAKAARSPNAANAPNPANHPKAPKAAGTTAGQQQQSAPAALGQSAAPQASQGTGSSQQLLNYLLAP